MAKIVTVFYCILIICATQSESFKIISKIKNYLLPTSTTTSTTPTPISPDFGGNDTNQETPWGEEATEEQFTATSERTPEDHGYQPGDSDSHLTNTTTTTRTIIASDAQPVYPGMPQPTPTTTYNGVGKLIPDQNSYGNAWQESTTTEGFDTSYNQPQDFLSGQNTTSGISDNDLGGFVPSGSDSEHSGGNNYGHSNSNNTQSGVNGVGESIYNAPDPNVNQIGGNEEVGNLDDPSTSGNRTSQQPGGNNDAGNLYGKPNSSGSLNAQQSGGSSYSSNAFGSKPNNNDTANNSHHEDALIYPDNPLLNPTPEPVKAYEVGCSRIALDAKKATPKTNAPVPVPDEGGRKVITAPVKDCGKGRQLNGKGECKDIARK